jgi:regulator of PEP synthase PpsR (kinase-PPPase family)
MVISTIKWVLLRVLGCIILAIIFMIHNEKGVIKMDKNYIYVVSDSLGDTAEKVAIATAEQFKDVNYEIVKFPYVTQMDQIENVIESANGKNAIVIFTLVIEKLRDRLIDLCEENAILYNDIMAPVLKDLATLFDSDPILKPGIIHQLDKEYFDRVAAVEFAVKYDDGKDVRGIKKADIVILGISRTSKTPLSMYMAHKNIKVANVPLVPEVDVPKEIFKLDPNKVIGLINTPEKLNEIRIERLKALGLKNNAKYANMDRIIEELDYAHKIYNKIGCKIIDVSNKAVEETANIIIDSVKSNKK